MLNDIKIDPEFENEIFPLTEIEFKQLEENILSDGIVITPLIVWNGILIDGHNRYKIIQKYPEISYTVHEIDFPNRFAAIAWVCKNQLGRRNLTFEQKKYLIGKQYEAEKHSIGAQTNNKNNSKNISKSSINGDFEKEKIQSGQNVHFVSNEKTSERIARENNVNERYVRRAERFAKGVDIAEESVSGSRQEILFGKFKPTDKEITLIMETSPLERPELIKKLKAERRKNNKIETQRIREISEKLEHPDLKSTPEDLLCELEDALDTLIFRWDMCINTHKEVFEVCKEKIDKLANTGIEYLQKIKQRH